MKRAVIKIDESRCTGCGACVKGCHGGALQIVDGKARVVNEMLCDGLGACIGICPCGALELEEENSTQSPQFPIQLRLISPNASFLKGADLILAADCTAFVCPSFHNKLKGNKSIVIACPKLDDSAEIYVEKLSNIIDSSSINTLTVILMEVPCCGGLWHIAQQAQANAKRQIPIQKVIIGVNGEIPTTR